MCQPPGNNPAACYSEILMHVKYKTPSRAVAIPLLVLLTLLGVACSSQEWNRTLYDTLGNMGDQQCSRETLTYCQQQQDYETYRKERAQPSRVD